MFSPGVWITFSTKPVENVRLIRLEALLQQLDKPGSPWYLRACVCAFIYLPKRTANLKRIYRVETLT